MKKSLIIMLVVFIVLTGILFRINFVKKDLVLQIGIKNQDIYECWENVKEKLGYDKYMITDIKSDGIECILVKQSNETMFKEINLEIVGSSKGKVNLHDVKSTLSQTTIKKVTELNEFPYYAYDANQIISKLAMISFDGFLVNETEGTSYRLEYKGFITKDKLENKFKGNETEKYILDEKGEQINYDSFSETYNENTNLMCLILNNQDKNSAEQIFEYIEIYIIM